MALSATQVAAYALGGWIPGHLVSLATNNATVVKATSGLLGYASGFSKIATPVYLKFYDKATAPNPAADTPVLVLEIPGNTAGAGFVLPWPQSGVFFLNGIGFAIVAGMADTDNTAVAAADCVIDYGWK